MPEKNYEGMLNAIFGSDEESRFQKGKDDVYYLWRWVLPRLLLGKNIEKALEYMQMQIKSFQLTQRSDVALKNWLELAALLEIFDESSKNFIKKTENFPNLQITPYAKNHRTVEFGLAAAFYLENTEELSNWREAALRLPLEIGAEYIIFELLFLTDMDSVKNLESENLADLTSNVVYKVLMGAPFYSSAPHILVLASIARTRNEQFSDLLKGRIKKLDKVTHDSDGKRLINYGKLKKTVEENVLTLTVTARGTGEIWTVCYDVSALTYDLPAFLVNLAEKNIFLPDTKIVAELILKQKVSISDKETETLKRRFNLALKITENQLDFTISDSNLIIKNQ